MNELIGIDLGAPQMAANGILVQPSIMGNATRDEMMNILAGNSLRPFIDPSDPFRQYASVPAFNAETGKYEEQTVCLGNAAPTTLLRGEWEQYDAEIIRVALGRMNIVQLLVNAGLTIPLNGMGVTRFTWNRTGKIGKARIDMDMSPSPDTDREVYDEQSIPIPVVSAGYDISMRQLAASRMTKMPADVVRAGWAAYAVAEFTENMFVNGANITADGGGTIYGLRNTPTAITDTMTAGWDDMAVTGAEIVEEVAGWIQTLRNQHHYGPFTLILPQKYSYKLSMDYNPNYASKSIHARLLELPELKNIVFSEFLHKKADGTDETKGEAFLLEMQKQTVAVLEGMPLTNFQYQIKGPFIVEHKVAQIRLPLFRNDIEGNTGLLYASFTPAIP